MTTTARLADLPEVRAGGEVCDAYLARVKRLHGWISSLRTTDAAGRGRCADRAEIRDVNIADRGYFRQAVASRDFVLSFTLRSPAPITNATPS